MPHHKDQKIGNIYLRWEENNYYYLYIQPGVQRKCHFKTILTIADGFDVPCVVTHARAVGGSRPTEVSVTRERGYRAHTILAIGQSSRVIR